MAQIRETPSLKDIAETYRQLAYDRAPVDTGRLRESIRVSYKKLSDLIYEMDLNMVSYGLWWNEPPKVVKRVKLARKPEFNFVYKAQSNAKLVDMIDERVRTTVLLEVTKKMQEAFEKGGYSKLRQSFGK